MILKPCPFCGGKARIMRGPDVWVECTECHAMSDFCAQGDKAVLRWNRRIER